MRIVDEWTRDDIRVTAFHMNGRYSLKLEKGLFEQHYKFRDGQFNDVKTLKNKMDDHFYAYCRQIFSNMEDNRLTLLENETDVDQFPTII